MNFPTMDHLGTFGADVSIEPGGPVATGPTLQMRTGAVQVRVPGEVFPRLVYPGAEPFGVEPDVRPLPGPTPPPPPTIEPITPIMEPAPQISIRVPPDVLPSVQQKVQIDRAAQLSAEEAARYAQMADREQAIRMATEAKVKELESQIQYMEAPPVTDIAIPEEKKDAGIPWWVIPLAAAGVIVLT